MDKDEEEELMHAYYNFIERSLNSQRGWARKGGPNRHLTPEQQRELADLRAAVRLYLLEHPPPPPPPNPEMDW